MFTAVIVEDDSKQIQILKKLIHDHCPQVELVGEARDLSAAAQMIKSNEPDMVFLDIVIKKSTIFDLLEKLSPFNFEIIFITAYEKHTLKAIKYMPLDYLIKPVKSSELQMAVSKAAEKITAKNIHRQLELLMSSLKTVQNRMSQKIAVPTLEGFVFVMVDDIIRCEANGAYTCIHTKRKEKITASKNIKEYEDLLPHYHFFRIHNSHLVNINRILRYNKGRGGSVIMEDGAQLEVASRRRAEFLSRFQ